MSAADLFEDLQSLSVDAPISLWTVDNSINGGSIYRFHSANQTGLSSDILFNGITYTAAPVMVRGVEETSSGKPRPTMIVGTQAAIELGLLTDPSGLLGAKATRIKTLAKYLDDGASPDPTSVYPSVSYFVEQLSEFTDTLATYRLADPTELPGVKLPRQRMLANLCSTCYRGETCQYTGDPVTDTSGVSFGAGPFTDRGTWSDATADYVADDYVTINSPDGSPMVWVALQSVPTGTRPGSSGSSAYWSLDVCFKRVADCELHFDAADGLPFDAFPGLARLG